MVLNMDRKNIRKNLIRDKLRLFRGTILSDSTDLESILGWKLRIYFFPKTNRRATLFDSLIIDKLTFEKKISLYEHINVYNKSKKHENIKRSLRFVKKLRNEVAHGWLLEGASNETSIVIKNPISYKTLTLDDKLMNEFKEHDKFLLKSLGWKETLREKYGTIS
jgi:hypothetical protein